MTICDYDVVVDTPHIGQVSTHGIDGGTIRHIDSLNGISAGHVLLRPPRPAPGFLPNLILGGTNFNEDIASVKSCISAPGLVMDEGEGLDLEDSASISGDACISELLLLSLPVLSSCAAELLLRKRPDRSMEFRESRPSLTIEKS